MLIHRICIAFSGFGAPTTVEYATKHNAAMEVEIWNRTKCLML